MDNYNLISAYPARPGAALSYYSLDLLVLAGNERVTSATIDSVEGHLVSAFEYAASAGHEIEMEALIGSEDIFRKPYRSVIIGMESPVSSLMPSALFDESRLANYLSLGQDLSPGEVLRKDEIRGTDIVNGYSLPEKHYRLMHERFPSARIVHHNTALIAGLNVYMKKRSTSHLVCCQIRRNLMDLVVFKAGKLNFCNTFQFTNKEEMVYYILFVLDQLGMNPADQDAAFFGDVDKGEELPEYCREYLGEITIGSHEPGGMVSLVAGTFPFHRYFNLLSLRLCG
jgi:hypothetical protein